MLKLAKGKSNSAKSNMKETYHASKLNIRQPLAWVWSHHPDRWCQYQYRHNHQIQLLSWRPKKRRANRVKSSRGSTRTSKKLRISKSGSTSNIGVSKPCKFRVRTSKDLPLEKRKPAIFKEVDCMVSNNVQYSYIINIGEVPPGNENELMRELLQIFRVNDTTFQFHKRAVCKTQILPQRNMTWLSCSLSPCASDQSDENTNKVPISTIPNDKWVLCVHGVYFICLIKLSTVSYSSSLYSWLISHILCCMVSYGLGISWL